MPDSLNLGCIFSDHLGQNRKALIDLAEGQERTLTFDELDHLASGVARGLRKHNLKPGDRVGVLALNRLEYLAVFFGAMRSGWSQHQ